MSSTRYTFSTLLVIVLIAGLSQGLTLPLLTILLAKMGVSSLANGVNAATLYIGILLISPWMEWPLRKFGYKTTIWIGLSAVTAATLLLPAFQNFAVWAILRMLLGMGDVCLHYASQMWVTNLAKTSHQGRSLSLYGFAYGAGFSIGPQGLFLLQFGTWVPFLSILVFYIVAFLMVSRLQNEFPPQLEAETIRENRHLAVVRLGWLALIPSFLYGYLEASLNSNFPVYALHMHISLQWIAAILSGFVVGSLILQLPLASLSDRYDRKKVMMASAFVGGCALALFPFSHNSVWAMIILFGVAGATVGSFYSLGLAFITDVLPKSMIPTAGIISGMNFSVACILAPNLNGFTLQYLWPGSMFLIMSVLLGLFFICGFFFRKSSVQEDSPMKAKRSLT